MQIHIIGTGDAYASSRANSAIVVVEQDFKLLIDCGPTACHQLWSNPVWPHLDAVYFTHLHPDHALGLTSLINRFNSSGRRRKLQIYCHKGKEQRLQQLVEYGFWSDRKNYQVEFILIDPETENGSFEIGPLQCQSEETFHGVTNHSIQLQGSNTRLFYSGDGAITPAGSKLVESCDIAFIECQAMSLAQGAGHSDFAKVKQLANSMPNVEFMLYHIADSEITAMSQAACEYVNINIAIQGESLKLK